MLLIGLTGGIGSGKTTVAGIFEVLGIPVYYADLEAKRIMNEDKHLRSQLTELFGKEVYVNGSLNRSQIAAIVFNDKEKLRQLNALVHPATIADSERWMKAQKSPYALKEAALIFESGSNSKLDCVIGVYSPIEMRIKRVMERDSISAAEVERRMLNQMQEDDKMNLCDFVIFNDEQQLLIPQVTALHEKLAQSSAVKL